MSYVEQEEPPEANVCNCSVCNIKKSCPSGTNCDVCVKMICFEESSTKQITVGSADSNLVSTTNTSVTFTFCNCNKILFNLKSHQPSCNTMKPLYTLSTNPYPANGGFYDPDDITIPSPTKGIGKSIPNCGNELCKIHNFSYFNDKPLEGWSTICGVETWTYLQGA